MDLAIDAGEIVTLMGRNGMGKTTTVRALMGLLRPRRGIVAFDGNDVDRLPDLPHRPAGIGLVPEGRQIFPNLTVRENLVAAAANRAARPSPWTLARVYELFPRLAERQRNLRQPALGRRAADAGDRPRADDQSAAADPRRGDRGPGAADPRRDLALPRRLKRDGLRSW